MKNIWKTVFSVFKVILVVITVGIMLFTIIAVTTFDRQDRSLFRYKLFIVLSDSMRATDFEAGDLILVEQIDTGKLKPGDVISYVSTNPSNYGKTVTHKIREIHRASDGSLGFVTYGTTSGINDDGVVLEESVLGVYRMRIPKVGKFFSFLKTIPGYILCVLLPFLVAIIYYASNSIRQFLEFRAEEVNAINLERKKLEEERRALMELYRSERNSNAEVTEEN